MEFRKKSGYVAVSTAFIDKYAGEANPSYVVIYLCALRAAEKGGNFDYGYFADILGVKESFVKKAFEYWQKNNVIKMENNIVEFTDIEYCDEEIAEEVEVTEKIEPEVKSKRNFFPNYSVDDFEKISEQDGENCRILISLAENQLYGRPIDYNERNFILALFYEFGFSLEVLAVLFSYCGENEKKDRRYIEKVAYDWYEKNIDTSEKAESYLSKFEDMNVIMRALGINEEPTKAERAKLDKWLSEYGFSLEVIKKGCEKAVENTMPNNKKGRIAYAERIFSQWHKSGIKTLADVSKSELDFLENKKKNTAKKSNANTSFSNYENQREFDPTEVSERQSQLMKELLAGGDGD